MAGEARETRTLALLVSIEAAAESDALLSFFASQEGALRAKARGLRKAQSKLAPLLKPADELLVTLARGRGATSVLTGVEVQRSHAPWREDLGLLALYWFLAECAYVGSGEAALNERLFQLIVNLLRSAPDDTSRYGAAAAFCLKALALHGLLPDLAHCMIDGHQLTVDEPSFLPLSGEGLIGRDAYNKHYARTGGGLLRLDPARRKRWQALRSGALLDYPGAGADALDAAVLVQLAARALGGMAVRAFRSAEFLALQWRLAAWTDLLRDQR